MSRTRRFVSGISFGYASQVLTTLVGLWLVPFLLHRVGQHDYGLWLMGTQLMFYLALLDLGVVALLPRETALITGRVDNSGRAEALTEMIGQTARLALWQTLVIALGAVIVWLLIPTAWGSLRWPLGIVLLGFVLVFPLRVLQGVLYGLQELAFLAKAQICTWLVSTGLTIGLIFAGLGLYALAIGWVAAQVLIIPILWYRLRERYPGVLPARLPSLSWKTARGRLTHGLWISTSQMAQVLLFGTDILIIGKLLGPAAVVPYACTGKLISVLVNQPQLLLQAAAPALTEMRAGETRDRVLRVCIALGQAMLIIGGAIVCVVLVVNQSFVEWWVGRELYGGFWLTTLFLANMLLRQWNLTIRCTLYCFGLDRHLTLTLLFDGIISAGLILLLVPLFGLTGGMIGSIIGVVLIGLPCNLVALARETGVSITYLLTPLWPWFWRFSLIALGAGFVARVWVPKGAFALAASAISAAAIYSLMMLPFVWRSSLRIYVRPWLPASLMRFFQGAAPGQPDVT